MPGTIWETAAMTVAGAMSGGLGVYTLKWWGSRRSRSARQQEASNAADAGMFGTLSSFVTSELREVREEVRTLRAELNIERQRSATAESRASELQAQVTQLRAENKALTRERDELRDNVASLQQQVSALRHELDGTVIGRASVPDGATP